MSYRQALGKVDSIITSPPYAENPGTPSLGSVNKDDWGKEGTDIVARRGLERGYSKDTDGQIGNLKYGSIDSIITSPPYGLGEGTGHSGNDLTGIRKDKYQAWQYGKEDGQIGNLSYGSIDSIITSPPFQEAEIKRSGQEKSRENYNYGSKFKMQSEHPNNISRLAENSYGSVDSIITSPPYEGSGFGQSNKNTGNVVNLNQQVVSRNRPISIAKGQKARQIRYADQTDNNLGNLKGDSYLSAMFQVYKACFAILRDGGLMILVTKNFIRNKQIVRLDLDTIKLCETANFRFIERHYRKLTSQSFWRTIYYQKYPDVEQITHEDILVFAKRNNETP